MPRPRAARERPGRMDRFEVRRRVECVVMLPICRSRSQPSRGARDGRGARDEIVPELRGMAQEPWAGVIRAMKARLDGGANTWPGLPSSPRPRSCSPANTRLVELCTCRKTKLISFYCANVYTVVYKVSPTEHDMATDYMAQPRPSPR